MFEKHAASLRNQGIKKWAAATRKKCGAGGVVAGGSSYRVAQKVGGGTRHLKKETIFDQGGFHFKWVHVYLKLGTPENRLLR